MVGVVNLPTVRHVSFLTVQLRRVLHIDATFLAKNGFQNDGSYIFFSLSYRRVAIRFIIYLDHGLIHRVAVLFLLKPVVRSGIELLK